MTKHLILALAIGFSALLQAQDKKFTINMAPAESVQGMQFYVQPLSVGKEHKAEQFSLNENSFAGTTDVALSGFYLLVAQRDNYQTLLTIYQPDDFSDVTLDLQLNDKMLYLDNTLENRLLSDFCRLTVKNGRSLWSAEPLGEEETLSLLRSYREFADSVSLLSGCSQAVKDYLKVAAYDAAHSACSNVFRDAKRSGRTFSFSNSDVTGDAKEMLDNEYALLQYSSLAIIASTVSHELSLVEQIENLYTNYKTEAVRDAVTATLIQRFIKTHNYSADFEGGLQQLKEVQAKYNLTPKFVKEYEMRRATIKGTSFPADVVLCDTAGNVVDFSTFKGKYVYIDLWASWCSPCVKEVPHLQKLEQELQNDNVAFLSISVDAKEAAWKNKMLALGMHGNQLLDKNNTISNALGIKGIPFFVIYDKDGRLYMYNAPRPSSGEVIHELLENLQ